MSGTRAPRAQGSRNVGAQGLARSDSPQPLAAARPSVGGGLATALCPADLSAGNRGSTDLGLAGTVWDRREVCSVTGAQLGVGEARSPHLPSPVPRPAPGQLVVAWKLPHAERRVTLPELVQARGPRSGGAGVFFGRRRLGETRSLGRATRRGKRAAGLSLREPILGAPASRTPRRAGAEDWVFAGEMRVSIQLAYKVPVLGCRDRWLLQAPCRLSPRSPELSAQAEKWTPAGLPSLESALERGWQGALTQGSVRRFEGSPRFAGARGKRP